MKDTFMNFNFNLHLINLMLDGSGNPEGHADHILDISTHIQINVSSKFFLK